MKIKLYILLFINLFGIGLFAQEKQKVDIQSGYLELRPEFPDAAIYTKDETGQVYIVHEGVEMWCDQAFVYIKDNFVKAYGQVRITQGDTISMNSKYAEYNGNTQFAFASGDVLLTEPKTTLRTDTLYFDRIKLAARFKILPVFLRAEAGDILQNLKNINFFPMSRSSIRNTWLKVINLIFSQNRETLIYMGHPQLKAKPALCIVSVDIMTLAVI